MGWLQLRASVVRASSSTLPSSLVKARAAQSLVAGSPLKWTLHGKGPGAQLGVELDH